jgi:uncharacterized iron-regulated protein
MVLLSSVMVAAAQQVFAAEAAPWQNWQTSIQSDDALVGKIWSAHERRFVTPRLLADALAEVELALLGETHDNADHHRLQAWLIDRIAKHRKPTVVMEMISVDQSKKLRLYLANPDANAAGLGEALEWAESGWPDWLLYQPIAESLFRVGLPLLPGDPSRHAIRSVGSGGLDHIERVELTRLALNAPLSPELSEALRQDIKESHCNLLPEGSLDPMTQVQRYRDAALARALIDASKGEGAILIAGNGHVRSDRGVPWYLFRQEVEPRISSVMFVEVLVGAKTVEDLIVTDPAGEPAADYFWITPRAEREDQCEELRRKLEK